MSGESKPAVTLPRPTMRLIAVDIRPESEKRKTPYQLRRASLFNFGSHSLARMPELAAPPISKTIEQAIAAIKRAGK